jgi:Na+-driven multidrug efflux pump
MPKTITADTAVFTDSEGFIRKLYGINVASSMIALSGNFLGNVVSSMIAGRFLSPDALAVVGMASPVYYAYATIGALLGIGCTSHTSNLIGHGKFDKVKKVFTLTYLLTVVLAILLSLCVFLFMDPLLTLLGAGANVEPQVRQMLRSYCIAMAFGGIGVMLIYPAFNLLRLDGKNLSVAICFISMAAITILLDIAVVLLFTDIVMKVTMLAVAMCAGALIAGVFGMISLLRGRGNFGFVKLSAQDIQDTPRLLIAGSPGAMENLCTLLCLLILNNLLSSRFGPMAVSSYKVVDSVNSIALIFIWGVVGPITPLAGVFGAERDTVSIKQVLKNALIIGMVSIAVYLFFCEAFAPQLAGWFGMTAGGTVIAIRLFVLSLPLSLLNHILIYLFMGMNRSVLANLLMISRMFVWVVAAAAVLMHTAGENYVWLAWLVAESMTAVLALLLTLIARHGNADIMRVLLLDLSGVRHGRYESFSVLPNNDSISRASEGINEFCDQCHINGKTSMALSLAIEEMLVVISGKCTPKYMNVRVLVDEKKEVIVLRIRNDGMLFNLVDYAEKAGGEEELDVMGVKLIMKMALSVDYRSTFGVNNSTILLNNQQHEKSAQ